MFNQHTLWALGLSALLAGCGGGADTAVNPIIPIEPNPEPIAFAAKGFWEGATYGSAEAAAARTSPWFATVIAVLPSGQAWGVNHYGEDSALTVRGGFHGNLNLSGTRLGGSVREVDEFGPATSTLQGDFSAGDSVLAYSLRSDSVLGDRYVSSTRAALPEAATTLADIAGNYAITSASKERYSKRTENVIIKSDGRFTYDDAGCQVDGTLSPKADGTDQFDVRVTFTERILYAGVCAAWPIDTPLAGLAFLQKTVSPPRLVGVALMEEPSDGFYFIGQRVVPVAPALSGDN